VGGRADIARTINVEVGPSRQRSRTSYYLIEVRLRVLAAKRCRTGPWVAALIAAGYTVYAITRCRRRGTRGVSGAKSDDADAHVWQTWWAPTSISSGR
jgi:hypothetical protein